MNPAPPKATLAFGLSLLLIVAGCKKPKADEHAEHGAEGAPPVTNRVDIPAPVRQNLGITFAKVERRRVAQTLRVPGTFELAPTARREYRAPAAGRIELTVTQFDAVAEGTLLYRLDSPRWRELQDQIASAEAAVEQARAQSASMAPLRDAHHRHEEGLAAKVKLWTERTVHLKALREAGGGSAKDLAEAEGTLNATQAELADTMEKDAELISRELEVQAAARAASTRLDLLLETAVALTGRTKAALAEGGSRPLWRSIDRIEVRAQAAGVVEAIAPTTGGQLDASGLVVVTVRPDLVRFRAKALQADLARLTPALPASITPPSGAPSLEGIPAVLTIGLTADAEERTVDLFASPSAPATGRPWVKAGVAGFLEITLAAPGSGTADLAIPASCIARDGVSPVIFRRDPANPDKVIRMEADVGLSDGRWTVINSGVMEGDEIVLNGVYPLMLATSGSAPKGGHFHSDGTFHTGKD
jgi:hypothetical protein